MTAIVTIGTFTTSRLTAQPFGYEGTARDGLTARTFRIAGLLTPAEWASLVGVYDTWRATRITDPDTLQSGTVGTTVALTLASINGLSVSGLACWFAEPPSGEQVGAYVQASVTLVDAAQALAVVLRQKEKAKDADKPNLGTVTLGSAVVTLTKPMDTRRDGPSVALTAAGTSYITGPLVAHKILAAFDHGFDLEGACVVMRPSIGIAVYPDHGTDQHHLLGRAPGRGDGLVGLVHALVSALEYGVAVAELEQRHVAGFLEHRGALGDIQASEVQVGGRVGVVVARR